MASPRSISTGKHRKKSTVSHDVNSAGRSTVAVGQKESRAVVSTLFPKSVSELESDCRTLFLQLTQVQCQIRTKLETYADGKNLKGNELVGWLGEIYGKLILGGQLVDDSEEYDVIVGDMRVSVKARKGSKKGWRRSSAIPRIEGEGCPTHLSFVHLNDDYSLDRIWLIEWSKLVRAGRFTSHKVRGTHRSYVFDIDERKDQEFVVFGN